MGVPPFDYMRKRFSGFNRFRGFKRGGAAHKKIEAPRSIDDGDAQKLYSSHQSLVTPNPQSLIPSYSSLPSNFRWMGSMTFQAQDRHSSLLLKSFPKIKKLFSIVKTFSVFGNLFTILNSLDFKTCQLRVCYNI